MRRETIAISLAGAALILFWITYAIGGVNWANQFLMRQGSDPVSAEQWGDAFGGFNAIIGALGFAGVLGTIFMQGRAFKEQQIDQYKQRFDSTFFQLLALLRELRNGARITPSGHYGASLTDMSERRGLEAFQYAADLLEYWSRQHAYPDMATKHGLALLYETEVHQNNEDELGPFFRVCYTILRRLSEDAILSNEDKIRFGNLLRGQLTTAELKIIAFNALTDDANNFQEYIEEFRLLKYLTKSHLTRELVEDFYDPLAFEARD